MKQGQLFQYGRAAREAAPKSDGIRLVLEFGLAVFIGLSALQLHQLLTAAAP